MTFCDLQVTSQNILKLSPVVLLVKEFVVSICLEGMHRERPHDVQDPNSLGDTSALTRMSLRLFGRRNATMGGSGKIFDSLGCLAMSLQ